MAAIHLKTQGPSPIAHAASNSLSSNASKCILVALGIIILIGSLVAAGFLYPQINLWALAVGGGGLIVGVGFFAVGLSCKAPSQPASQTQSVQNSKIPIQASDIQVPENIDFPEKIPGFDPNTKITPDKKWVSGLGLHLYITYLATQFPGTIAVFPKNSLYYYIKSFHPGEPLRETLTPSIFHTLPSEIKDFDTLNIPLFVEVPGHHWVLVYIDRKKGTVEYYDCLKNFGKYDAVKQILTKIADKLGYQFVHKINHILDNSGNDCGIWVLYFLESKLKNPDVDFNQLDIEELQNIIKKYRKHVILKILEMASVVEEFTKSKQELWHDFHDIWDQLLESRPELVKLDYVDAWRQLLNEKAAK
jgi:hypothetical protein